MAVMPTNLYGPNDNYDLNNSHVLPALLRKIHLTQLAQQGDYASIERNETIYGKVPENLRASLGLEPNAKLYNPNPTVTVWGTGTPKREFLYSDDMADACLFLLNQSINNFADLFNDDTPPLINIGCGEDLTIRELAEMIAEIVNFRGELVFDTTKPDGPKRKLMDVSRMKNIGWTASTNMRQGILKTFKSYLEESQIK
jgi:GDP-L-fucose synthase